MEQTSRQDRQRGRDLRHARRRGRRPQRFAQSRRDRRAEHVVHRRPAQIRVDEQDPPVVRAAQRQRQIDDGERLSLLGNGARHRHRPQVLFFLEMMQRRRESPVLFDRARRKLVAGDELVRVRGPECLPGRGIERPPALGDRRGGMDADVERRGGMDADVERRGGMDADVEPRGAALECRLRRVQVERLRRTPPAKRFGRVRRRREHRGVVRLS